MSRDRPSPLRFVVVALVLALVIYGGMTVGRLWFDSDHLAGQTGAELANLGLAESVTLPDPLEVAWDGGPVVRTNCQVGGEREQQRHGQSQNQGQRRKGRLSLCSHRWLCLQYLPKRQRKSSTAYEYRDR